MTNEPVISLMGSVAEGVEGLGNEPFSQAAFALGNWREPDMSAVRFLQALSGDRLDSPVPVIVVVDAPDKERRRELFRAGVQDYLVHSDAVKLTTAVENAMERQSWRGEKRVRPPFCRPAMLHCHYGPRKRRLTLFSPYNKFRPTRA